MRFQYALPLLSGSSVSATTKYEEYILTPSSRTIYPSSLYNVNGTVDRAESLISSSPGSAVFRDASAATYDYGKNIGGVVTLKIGSVSDANQIIGVTFSESSLWISGKWSDATADAGNDEPLWFQPTGPGDYTVDLKYQRGGFKYLSLVHNTTGTVEVQIVEIFYTAVPHLEEDQMRSYSGWFHSDDELINRIWYAGAYTAQLCTIDPHYGNSLNLLEEVTSNMTIDGALPWWSNYTIANSTSVLTDGPKRDRLLWPGDMVVSWPSMLVSTNDKVTVTNSLDALFDLQNQTTGILPYTGLPFDFGYSATYHLHNLIGAAEVHVYNGDMEWFLPKWEQWKFAMNYSLSTIDDSGLMNVTSASDWLRSGMGGHNIEANAILYHTLQYGIVLAAALNESDLIPRYETAAATLKESANALLWDPSQNLFYDNDTIQVPESVRPQDSNSWAVLANFTTPERAAAISSSLISRWGPYGAPAPEAGATISPFVGYFELRAHAAAKNTTALLDLLKLQWGFMLDDPRMTNSTFIEGYSTDGSLHYAPYTNDPRVSHAHGWSTGPTSVLSMSVAGIQILTAGGKTWKIAPRLGGLRNVDAGFSTAVGLFSAKTDIGDDGSLSVDFEAPSGTSGSVSIEWPSCDGTLKLRNVGGECEDQSFEVKGREDSQGDVVVEGVAGGQWELRFTCS